MDLILWPVSLVMLSTLSLCFNPCFGGSYIMTLINLTNNYPCHKFQSLFWWILYYDRAWEMQEVVRDVVSILVLVDLILWRQNSICRMSNDIVSILVLVDLILWLACSSSVVVLIFSFQSLFWWILYYDLGRIWWELQSMLVSILVLVDLILWPFFIW